VSALLILFRMDLARLLFSPFHTDVFPLENSYQIVVLCFVSEIWGSFKEYGFCKDLRLESIGRFSASRRVVLLTLSGAHF